MWFCFGVFRVSLVGCVGIASGDLARLVLGYRFGTLVFVIRFVWFVRV